MATNKAIKDEALKLLLEGAANYIDVLGGDSRKYRQALAAPVQPVKPSLWEQYHAAQPAPVQPVAWTERELELIDGMIEVQLDHAKRCDSIANRTMADKQKGWDLERVALLQKIKATPPAAQTAVQEPVVFFRCNGCGHAYEQVHPTSCDCMEAGGFERVEYYTTPPAAQTAVQEPIGYAVPTFDFDNSVIKKVHYAGTVPLYTIPPAQPAVPDALTSADIQEHIEYVAGWNDCRAEMLKE
jgi:hypothetical protein